MNHQLKKKFEKSMMDGQNLNVIFYGIALFPQFF
jgi:hypothetical protein